MARASFQAPSSTPPFQRHFFIWDVGFCCEYQPKRPGTFEWHRVMLLKTLNSSEILASVVLCPPKVSTKTRLPAHQERNRMSATRRHGQCSASGPRLRVAALRSQRLRGQLHRSASEPPRRTLPLPRQRHQLQCCRSASVALAPRPLKEELLKRGRSASAPYQLLLQTQRRRGRGRGRLSSAGRLLRLRRPRARLRQQRAQGHSVLAHRRRELRLSRRPQQATRLLQRLPRRRTRSEPWRRPARPARRLQRRHSVPQQARSVHRPPLQKPACSAKHHLQLRSAACLQHRLPRRIRSVHRLLRRLRALSESRPQQRHQRQRHSASRFVRARKP